MPASAVAKATPSMAGSFARVSGANGETLEALAMGNLQFDEGAFSDEVGTGSSTKMRQTPKRLPETDRAAIIKRPDQELEAKSSTLGLCSILRGVGGLRLALALDHCVAILDRLL